MAKFATVDDYIAAIPEPLRKVATATRLAIDTGFPEAQAAIRWAHPTWSLGKHPVCYLKAASAHITFGFWRGASIEDSSKRLQTSGHVMAHVKLRTLDDVDADLIANWLRQAQELELQAEN